MQLTRLHPSLRVRVPRATTSCPRVARFAPRATPDNGHDAAPSTSAPPAENTVFYGGKTYTEAEFAAATQAGLPAGASSPVRGPAAAAALQPSFTDVMGFSGAPELINGRLAMLGFVAAVAAELSSGESVLRQLGDEPTGIASVFLLIIAASLVPAFSGAKGQVLGLLTPAAEMTNGRAAMIGIAAMLVLEAIRGVALF